MRTREVFNGNSHCTNIYFFKNDLLAQCTVLSLHFSPDRFRHVFTYGVLWSQSRPEPDFFAGAGPGEKESALAPDCVYVI